MDLFTADPKAPLPEKLRPQSVKDIVGQDHLLGPMGALGMALEGGHQHSFILWGPPGVGKTTLGRLVAKSWGAEFMTLSAVTAGVKEVRACVDAARHILDRNGKSSVVFVDEIHAFNRSQQDALLPHVESGLVTLIGGTTENPSFSLNNALLSRAQVYVMKSLGPEALGALYRRALPHLAGITVSEGALSHLAELSDGDGRRFLNLLEQVGAAAAGQKLPQADEALVRSCIGETLRRFDKQGESHYDQISAFQKSIRGSSPDGALYWLARMLDAGMDPRYVARRLVVIASEDVGNADPRALQLALNAAEAYERLGSPEGDRALAQAAVYLAAAPKSNAVYLAWNEVREYVRQHGSDEVPMHLRNAPTALMAELGYHKGYRYPHDEPLAYAAGEQYLPEGVFVPGGWYRPNLRGVEARIAERLQELKCLDAQADAAASTKGNCRQG